MRDDQKAGAASFRLPDVRSPSLPKSKENLRLRLYFALFVCDAVAIVGGCVIGNLIRYGQLVSDDTANIFGFAVPLYMLTAFNNDAYSLGVLERRHSVSRALSALFAAMVTILFIAFFLKAGSDFSRISVAVGGISAAGLLVLFRLSFRRVIKNLYHGEIKNEILILDGLEFEVQGPCCVIDANVAQLVPNMSDPLTLDQLGTVLKDSDRVVVACPANKRVDWAMALKGANVYGELLMPELESYGAFGSSVFQGTPTIIVATGGIGLKNRVIKRLFDLAMVLPLALVVIPLCLIVAIAIRVDNPGPVFFAQTRLGRGNRFFTMYKFRSMRSEAADAQGQRSASRDDNRITRVGRFLRATSVDEIPQIWNILKGEMSFVGPRPHALGSRAGDRLFWEIDQRYWHRHTSKPGLTGLAQVRGHRGATLKQADLTNRLQADLEYVSGWTIWKDISIIISTCRVIVHKNAF